MDKRLWDSMGYQLSRKGKEYQRRYGSQHSIWDQPYGFYYSCTFRTNPIHKGDKVIPPASFPAATLPDLKTLPDDLPVVNDQVLEEVCHNLIAKYHLLITPVASRVACVSPLPL
jgi:hypothetical protein